MAGTINEARFEIASNSPKHSGTGNGTDHLIADLRHRGLKRLFENDDRSKVPAEYADRLRIILAALDAAARVEDMDIHTFRLHPLKGDLKGFWTVTVRANWRVVFRFSEGNADDVDLVDYH